MPILDISTPKDSHKIGVGPTANGGVRFAILRNNPVGPDEVLAWVDLSPARVRIFHRMFEQLLDELDGKITVSKKLVHSRNRDHLHARVIGWHRKVFDALRRIVAR